MAQAPEPRIPGLPAPGDWRSFFAGQQVKCPVCRCRVGDVVAARIDVRVARPTAIEDGEPALIVKCPGFRPIDSAAHSSGRAYSRERCGAPLEIQMHRLA